MRLPKTYEPNQYEEDIYRLWEQSETFVPSGAGKPYSVVVPPPNANGNLHIGHALTLALEDIAVRYHRLKGERALLLPGADHAGFETQVVYERELAKEGKSRFDFTREELYGQIWEFVAKNRTNYEQQFRRLGAGVDWSRYVFTLDEKITRRAYATFRKMWDERLVYRGERLVNFCTFHGTAFADIEVAYKETAGSLWFVNYPLSDGSGEITVATTRPETMLGDTAVAVHPQDKRYKKYIGKTLTLPLVGREIPVIADTFVDPEFGTGAVKITPAHDPNDFEAGQRHRLPLITVINHKGLIADDMPEPYRGLTVEQARKHVIKDLEVQGALAKIEPHAHNVGHCYKCGTVIQPLVREQWFIDMKPLAGKAIAALKAGKVVFYPAAKREQLITYLEGLRDWNISRQIAWGIPIPAFQNVNEPDDWIYNENVQAELIEVNGKTYRRDPDVFDTWFSSGSWPYATLDFPDSQDFRDFYPLSLMETGFDILMPWVSRMLMLGLYVTGKVPFKAVYLHGLVLDGHGQKMSKSKGNVVNPLEIAAEYGSDALRMGLVAGQSAGNNQPFGLAKIIGARNFCNKLWNVARYVEDTLGPDFRVAAAPKPETDADHWILRKLQQTTDVIAADLDSYHFAEAYEKLYHFVWDDFADWYVEASKAGKNTGVLAYCLESVLVLAHPFAPFVTETIWQTLAWQPDTILAASRWPAVPPRSNAQAAERFEQLRAIVAEIRHIKTSVGLTAAVPLRYTGTELLAGPYVAALLKQLARISQVTTEGEGGLQLASVADDCRLGLDDRTIGRYKNKLAARLADAAADLARLDARLANKQYVANAPTVMVSETRGQQAEALARLNRLTAELDRLKT